MVVIANRSVWIPVLDGKIYCSPACGFKCTKKAYDEAFIAANKLASKLGTQWQSEVWENLGWHWKVTCSKVAVRVSSNGDYLATIASYNSQYSEKASSPKEALKRVIAACEDEVERLKKILGEVRP